MNCAICKNKIAILFLQKIKGTYIRKSGKKHAVCFDCQKKFKNKQELLNNL